MNSFLRYAPVSLSAGLAVWLEGLVTIEWSYPYCLNQSDGPAYAAQGMPLPYWMWNGVVSLEHDFMPHIYLLNVILIGLLLFPAVLWLLGRDVFRRSTLLRSLIGAIGCLLLLSHVALTIFLVSTGYYRPVKSVGLNGYYSYSDFRPVRIGLYSSNAVPCTPSHFWFPDGWQHN